VEMELRDEMQRVALEWPAYGYRRITPELQDRGFQVNHKRELRMMREDNLLCVRRRRFVVTTDSRHNCVCQPDLAHFDTLIWPPCGTNNSFLPRPFAVFGGPGRSEAQRRRLCGAFGRA